MKTARFAVYAIFLIAALTVAVHVRLWLEGIDASPAATIYRTRTRTVYVEVERDKKAEKGLTRTVVPCRKVEVLVDPDAPAAPSDTSLGANPLPPVDLLGVFRLPPLPEGGSARATLDEDGLAHLEVKAKPLSLFALGRLREVGVWGGVRLDDSSVRTWALSYQQDIVRIGPAWLRGRAEYGDDGFGSGGKAELGIAVRF